MTALLYHLDGADAALVERALVAANSAQPELLQKLEDLLLLDYHSAGKQLDNTELGVLYVIARTVIAVLHNATLASPPFHE